VCTFAEIEIEASTQPPGVIRRVIELAGASGIGIEVEVREGLPHDGVVRGGASPDEHTYCTWMITMARKSRASALGCCRAGSSIGLPTLRVARIEECAAGGFAIRRSPQGSDSLTMAAWIRGGKAT